MEERAWIFIIDLSNCLIINVVFKCFYIHFTFLDILLIVNDFLNNRLFVSLHIVYLLIIKKPSQIFIDLPIICEIIYGRLKSIIFIS